VREAARADGATGEERRHHLRHALVQRMMAVAYVLACELHNCDGDYGAAFARYHQRLSGLPLVVDVFIAREQRDPLELPEHGS